VYQALAWDTAARKAYGEAREFEIESTSSRLEDQAVSSQGMRDDVQALLDQSRVLAEVAQREMKRARQVEQMHRAGSKERRCSNSKQPQKLQVSEGRKTVSPLFVVESYEEDHDSKHSNNLKQAQNSQGLTLETFKIQMHDHTHEHTGQVQAQRAQQDGWQSPSSSETEAVTAINILANAANKQHLQRSIPPLPSDDLALNLHTTPTWNSELQQKPANFEQGAASPSPPMDLKENISISSRLHIGESEVQLSTSNHVFLGNKEPLSPNSPHTCSDVDYYSMDSSRINFLSPQQGTRHISMIETLGNKEQLLPNSPSMCSDVDYHSMDSSHINFSSPQQGTRHISVIGTLQPMTSSTVGPSRNEYVCSSDTRPSSEAGCTAQMPSISEKDPSPGSVNHGTATARDGHVVEDHCERLVLTLAMQLKHIAGHEASFADQVSALV